MGKPKFRPLSINTKVYIATLLSKTKLGKTLIYIRTEKLRRHFNQFESQVGRNELLAFYNLLKSGMSVLDEEFWKTSGLSNDQMDYILVNYRMLCNKYEVPFI